MARKKTILNVQHGHFLLISWNTLAASKIGTSHDFSSGTDPHWEYPSHTGILMKEPVSEANFALVGKKPLNSPFLGGMAGGKDKSWGHTKISSSTYFLKSNLKACQIPWTLTFITKAKYWFTALSGTQWWLIAFAKYLLLPFHYWDSSACITKGFWVCDKEFWLLKNSAAQFANPEGYFKTKLPWNTVISIMNGYACSLDFFLLK